ncbi:MAG: ABC transporter permease [Lachnospiraceae bacterium]|nr:ABC transporter permease [Lachnospiraceae bacterium]
MKRLKGFIGKAYLALVFVFLYAPIVTLIVYSFNDGKGRKWQGFSLRWYEELFQSSQIGDAVMNTLTIAFLSALIATLIGVISCIGIQAMSNRFRNVYMAINNIPLLNSDLVTGLSLMLVFIAFGFTFGYSTVLLAHITFNIPYVILSVMPRLRQANQSTYEAALDLGANPVQAFFKVIVPEILPGIVSGFLMAFTMSLDDFIITHFTKGPGINTISTLIYTQVRRGIKPSMNALSTIMFLSAIVLLVLTNLDFDKKKKKA